jgi:exonuclease III
MRIVFWNICAGGGVRAQRIAGRLVRWAPDVVALCEFRGTPPSAVVATALAAHGLTHQCTSWPWGPRHGPQTPREARGTPAKPWRSSKRLQAPGASRATNGLLLASRWPLRRIRGRAEPSEPGRWLLAEVAAPAPFTAGVMHVPNRMTGRKDAFYAEVLSMIRGWRRGPAVLLGDTNSGRPDLDEEVPVFGPREVAWLDAVERLGWADAFRVLRGDARAYTWYSPNGRNGFRLDQAFVNRALQPRLKGIVYDWGRRPRAGAGLPLSDHAALVLDLN